MSDPAMMSRAKQVAVYIVQDWMLLNEIERTMDKLVEEIELELDRSFEAGMRAASHAMPMIRAQAFEEAGQAAMDCDVSQCDAYMARRDIAVAIRVLKEQAPSPPRTP